MPHIQIYRLQSKRRALDAEIRAERASRTPDARRLLQLEAEKRAVWDEIARLQLV
ncbi:hypothetical protein [Phenylobacterium sp.]|jgi:hypothetical protein|uniref:hypothetical protein n=1 Tax=Phenylobacterium sp. TaxID=1871053 RepID=UPI002F95D82A